MANTHTVSLEFPAHVFPAPRWEDAVAAFATAHALSERQYWGNGRWGRHREMRHSSRRAIGYLGAYEALGTPAYLARSREALIFLLNHQQPEGHWLWYGPSPNGLGGGDFDYYETAIAGVALVEGYRITGETRCLDASRRAARYLQRLPLSPNTNYNLFGVWHLARHHSVEPDDALLDAAIYKTLYGGLPGQLPSGGWPGHNSWIWYHGIILRGMAELWNVLPANHPFRETMRTCFFRALNRLAREMEPSGRVPPNPGETEHRHRNAFSIAATLSAEEALGEPVRALTNGLMHYRLSGLPAVPETAERPQGDPDARDGTGREVLRVPIGRFEPDGEWGERPAGWHNAWIPAFEPQAGQLLWRRHTAWVAEGLELRVHEAEGNRGAAYAVPQGTLVPGTPYRFRASVAALENCEGSHCMSAVWGAVYAGTPRDIWDAQTGCEHVTETAQVGVFREVAVDFTAGETNYLYLLPMGMHARPGGEFGLLVRDASIHERIPAPPNTIPAGLLSNLDTEVMAFGLYLKHRRQKAEG